MKRILISSFLFTCIFIFSIIGTNKIEKHINPIITELEFAIEFYNNDDLTEYKKSINIANKYWNSSQTYLGVVLRHGELDEIENDLVRLLSISNSSEELEHLETECYSLISKLNHLITKEQLTVKNIF